MRSAGHSYPSSRELTCASPTTLFSCSLPSAARGTGGPAQGEGEAPTSWLAPELRRPLPLGRAWDVPALELLVSPEHHGSSEQEGACPAARRGAGLGAGSTRRGRGGGGERHRFFPKLFPHAHLLSCVCRWQLHEFCFTLLQLFF